MSTEETLYQVRIEKHRSLNDQTYPLCGKTLLTCFAANHLMTQNPPPVSLNPADLSTSVSVAGRISAIRKSGGITFIKITDASCSMQVIANRAFMPDYDKLKLLDLGDIIEISGLCCLSKTNENSILIQEWKVLTKAHKPPPEKFAGLSDQEIKYRQRYLDLMSSEESRARFICRTYIIQAIRHFLNSRRFLEVETSTLNVVASGANAKPFITHHNALGVDLRLRIAPELYLKRLLVGGLDRVYEIGRNYRNEGIDTRHNPEFTMLEAYQTYESFPGLIKFTKSLIQEIDGFLEQNLPSSSLVHYLRFKSERKFSLEFIELPMLEAVRNAARKANITISHDIDINSDAVAESTIVANDSLNERVNLIDLNQLVFNINKAKSNGEKVALLFEYLAEPFLTDDYRTPDGKYSCPVFITQYPKAISPLARATDDNNSICDRFELFVEGRELANGFQELNDPNEQSLRFKDQIENNHKDPMDFDSDYIEALEYGMPPAVGLGIGIDRLVMLFTNCTCIRDVILFPTLKPKS